MRAGRDCLIIKVMAGLRQALAHPQREEPGKRCEGAVREGRRAAEREAHPRW